MPGIITLEDALLTVLNEVPKLPPVLAPSIHTIGPGDQRIDTIMPVGIPVDATPNNDLLIAFMCTGNDTIGVPGGWSTGESRLHTSGLRAGWFYKTCAPGDPGTTYNFTTGSAHEIAAIGFAVQGVDLTSPIFNNASSAGAATTATGDTLVGSPEYAYGLYLVAKNSNKSIGLVGSAFVERFEVIQSSQRGIEGTDAVGYQAGSIPVPTWTFPDSASFLTFAVGLRPRPA